MKYDGLLALWVLNRIPSAGQRIPGHITPEDRQSRIHAINARAAVPLQSVKALVSKPSKLQTRMGEYCLRQLRLFDQ